MPDSASLYQATVDWAGYFVSAVWNGQIYVITENFNPWSADAASTFAHELTHIMQGQYYGNVPQYSYTFDATHAHTALIDEPLRDGDQQAALVEFLHAIEIDPGDEAAQQEIAKVRKTQGEVAQQAESSLALQPGKQEAIDSMGAPVELKPISNEPLTLHMTEDTKMIYQAIGRAAGINVLFDPDYTSKRIQVDLSNMTLLDALRVVGAMSNTFWRPVTVNTIFVAAKTAPSTPRWRSRRSRPSTWPTPGSRTI